MGFNADPDTLSRVTDTLHGARADLEGIIGDPPQVQAGELTEFVSATVALVCERMGELSAALVGVGDVVADGRADYLTTDDDQAAELNGSTGQD